MQLTTAFRLFIGPFLIRPRQHTRSSSPALQALTAAAFALPGLMPSPVLAADEEVDVLYGHYQEGKRDLLGVNSRFKPIEVESLLGTAKAKLTDRVKFIFNYTQDTWSGATPITTSPLSFGGNSRWGTAYADSQIINDTQSGATPYLLNQGFIALDKNLKPLKEDPLTHALSRDMQLVHTLSLASPETRKQGDFKLGYEWDEAGLDIGGGISLENDYESRFGNIGGYLDFNQKLTRLNWSLSYTASDTQALIDHDAAPYFYETSYGFPTYNKPSRSSRLVMDNGNGNIILSGKRDDWENHFSLTQILNKNALLETTVSYTHSAGYMANPYKAVEVAFIDPDQQFCTGAATGFCADAYGLLEQRPDERNQGTISTRYVQHIEAFDAAVHLDYRFFQDDWGISAHTFQADWAQPLGDSWTLTPQVRYYSQEAADFYYPYLVSNQPVNPKIIDPIKGTVYYDANVGENGSHYYVDTSYSGEDIYGNTIKNGYYEWGGSASFKDAQGNRVLNADGNIVNLTGEFDRSKLPGHYSSDHRLSGYGALSGGITLSKQFAKGITLNAGFEYYAHAGSLKMGGGGEGDYADFDYWVANGSLKVDLSAMSFKNNNGHLHEFHPHHANAVPAGVMFGHMLEKSGEVMIGYRYMYNPQSGALLHGTDTVTDQTIVQGGCDGNPCFIAPTEMTMHMHMLDVMYAPTDWLNLMLMPQFVDMGMEQRQLNGPWPRDPVNEELRLIQHHTLHEHTTGGIGDTGLYALFKILNKSGHHLHATLGMSAPTGDVGIKLRDTHGIKAGFVHYGMQLGSGTWDFKPSVTYTGQADAWSWGAQIGGTVRLEDSNESGFVLGDMFQSSLWGAYQVLPWLTATVRGVYTAQDRLQGEFNGLFYKLGPVDYGSSYGGRYWDMGFGLNAAVLHGDLQGNSISFEWLQPVQTDVNGYQLNRDGALSLNWSYGF